MYTYRMIQCKECGFECSAANALSYHLRNHTLTYVDYIVKYDYTGQWPCCECGKKLSFKKGGFPRFCSKSCSSTYANGMSGRIGENSPNHGKKRTEEQLKNYSKGAEKRWQEHGDMLREMMKMSEYRKAQNEAQLKSYKTSKHALHVSEGLYRFWAVDSNLTRRLRSEMSTRAVKSLNENKIGPHAPFRAEHKYNPFTDAEEYMHSSYETLFLDVCIAKNYPVTKDHKIQIEYVQPDNSRHLYVPDFYGFEDRTLYEIKGRSNEIDEAKWAAAREWCEQRGWMFVVLFEQDITCE